MVASNFAVYGMIALQVLVWVGIIWLITYGIGYSSKIKLWHWLAVYVVFYIAAVLVGLADYNRLLLRAYSLRALSSRLK